MRHSSPQHTAQLACKDPLLLAPLLPEQAAQGGQAGGEYGCEGQRS